MNHDDLTTKQTKTAQDDSLLDRVVQILEQARANVVRTVNSSMVTAHWLIGREIVLELQGGDERAEYGKQVIENLSKQLVQRYGTGYSVTSLQYFRKFYQAYTARSPIARPVGAESSLENSSIEISRPMGAELLASGEKRPAAGESIHGFSPQLSWSHYRALMRIAKPDARDFYEREAIEGGWDKRSLERQIHWGEISDSHSFAVNESGLHKAGK